ncbi:MAG: hypothetical protein ACUVXA_20115 [Candidatus Jordarchaeum sp.]|uniref:hypothetical protein n=1 Tax=Candidatus Jordarchaeum sp. TaxID=2823881 RepID=UPI00404B7FD3
MGKFRTTVLAWVRQPINSGTEAIRYPSSSLSTTTAKKVSALKPRSTDFTYIYDLIK